MTAHCLFSLSVSITFPIHLFFPSKKSFYLDQPWNCNLYGEFIGRELVEFTRRSFPLYVTEWDVTLSCRNFLNESCYRAVYLLKNLVACMENVELMSCSGSLDMQCEYFDSALPLNGGFGLLTKNGIKKPAFYAFTFLNRMGKYLLAKGEHYLVTADSYSGYAIILFHCCQQKKQTGSWLDFI